MARHGLYKFRRAEKKHLLYDILVMTLGVTAGMLALVIIFQAVALVNYRAKDETAVLRGSAPETAQIVPQYLQPDSLPASPAQSGQQGSLQILQPAGQNAQSASQNAQPAGILTKAGEVKVAVEKYDGYAGVGQTDVSLMKFSLTASADGRLRQIRVDLDGYASAADVKSFQLYYENKLAGQAPVLDAKAVFDKLDIELSAAQPARFEIKGNISETARSGDRLQAGFRDFSAITVRDADLHDFTAGGDFPLWGGYISVIGNKMQKAV